MVPTPNSPYVQSRAHERAAVVATAVLQIFEAWLRAMLRSEPSEAGALRSEIAAKLRDEFDDVMRTTLNEIRPPDE